MNIVGGLLIAAGIMCLLKGKSILFDDPSDWLAQGFGPPEHDPLVKVLGGTRSAMLGAFAIYVAIGLALGAGGLHIFG